MNWYQDGDTIHIEIDQDDLGWPITLPQCAVGDSLQIMLYDASTDIMYPMAAQRR